MKEQTLFFYQLRGSLLALLVAVVTIGGVIYHYAENSLLETVQSNLQYHADFRKQRILDQFNQQKLWMEEVSHSSGLVGFTRSLLDVYRLQGGDSVNYRLYRDRFRREYGELLNSQGINDLLLLDPDGRLAFSLRPMEEEIGVDLSIEGFYGRNGLSELVEDVQREHTFSISRYGKVEQIEASTVLMGIPLFSQDQDKELIGILIRPFSLQRLRGLLSEYSGLGASGEVMIAQWRGGGIGSGVNFINHFRNDVERQPDEACITLRTHQPERFPVMHALSETNGAGWMIDNSCRQTYAVWSWIPELRWGMVIKQDREEILKPVVTLQHKVLFASLLMLLFLFWMVHRQARSLVEPLEQLSNAAETNRVEQHQQGRVREVNQLSSTLKKVFSALYEYQQKLEQKVEARTEALSEMNRDLLQQKKELAKKNSTIQKQRDFSESIFTSVQEGMVVVDNRGRIVEVNQKIVSLLGCVSAAEMQGRRIGRFFKEEKDGELWGEMLYMVNNRLQELHDYNHDSFHQILIEAPIPLLVADLQPKQPIRLFIINEEMERTLGYPPGTLYATELEPLVEQKSWTDLKQLIEQAEAGNRCIESESCHFQTREGAVVSGSICMFSILCDGDHHVILMLKTEDTLDEALLRLTPFGKLFIEQKESDTEERHGILSAERRMLRCDGGELPVQISGALLQGSEEAHIEGAVLAVHDLSERKALEKAAQEAAYQGGMAEISSHVLHNFGNGLTSVGAYLGELHTLDTFMLRMAELIEQEKSDFDRSDLASAMREAHHQYLGEALGETKRTTRHMSNILIAQKGVVGDGGQYWVSRFNLKEVLEGALLLLRNRLERSQIELTLECAPQLEEVELPKNPLQQMVINLVKNSIEAIEEKYQSGEMMLGCGEIHLNFTPRGTSHFLLQCEDNGIGFPEEIIPNLFMPTFTTKRTSNGQGLHSVANFVRSIGGEPVLTSPGEGLGAHFEAVLPIRVEHE